MQKYQFYIYDTEKYHIVNFEVVMMADNFVSLVMFSDT